MRPWITPACHLTVFCHLGATRNLRMPELFYGWIGMNIYTQWWLRNCLRCRARHCRQHRLLRPLPVTSRGNTYILLFIDHFRRRADMSAVTAAELTAEAKANVLINRYIPVRGCPCSILSDNGLQRCSKLFHAVQQLTGLRKNATSSYHPNGNGEVECANHTMAQMLAMVVKELQNN